MKYTAKELSNGKFAVCAGKKWFANTMRDTMEKAHEEAVTMSLQWHYQQARDLFEELEKIDPARYDKYVPRGDYEHKTTFGDLNC